MVWKPGFIGFLSLKENTPRNRIRARAASALFVYLWCKRVDPGIAAHCAEAYVNFFEADASDEEKHVNVDD